MKKHQFSALILVLLLIISLCACSARSEADSMLQNSAADFAPSEAPKWDDGDEVMEEDETEEEIVTSVYGESLETVQMSTISEKIIYSGYVNLETTSFDKTLTALSQAVNQAGGFIQNSNVQGRTSYNSDGSTTIVDRWAYYTIRVPSAQFDNFMAMTSGMGNVTSSSRDAQNVTSRYTDYEARLNSLTIQEERLLEMLEKSGDLDSLITLESRLSEVRYEIESIERNLRNLDQQISYSTINLDIHEVEVFTPTTPVTRSFGEKMADAFSDGWNGFIRSVQNFCIWFAESLPTLIILAIIATVIVLFIRKLRRKHNAKSTPTEN